MKWKRNLASYPLWVLMLMLGLAGLVLSTVNASFAFDANEVVGAVIFIVLLTIAGSGTYFLHLYKSNHPYEFEMPMWGYVLTGLLLLGCCAAGIAMAVMNVPSDELTSPYFYAAEVQAGCRAPYFVHGATNTYVAFLNKVFFFFGNRAIMGIYAQIVLWMAVILFLGVGVWLTVSKKAAAVTMILAALLPALRADAVKFSPIMLYLACWSAVFAWLCLSEKFRKKEIVTGISCFLIGLCIYFDLSGILLLPIYLAIVMCGKKEGEAASKKTILIRTGIGIAALAVAFFLCIAMDASFSEKPFGDVLQVWFTTYPGGEILPRQLYQAVAAKEFVPVYFLICLGVFAFWRDRSRDAFKGWMFALFCVIAFFACGLSSERVTGESMLAVMLSVMAGVGLESVLAVVENVPVEKKPEGEPEEQPEKPKKKKDKKKNEAAETKAANKDDADKWIPLEEELDAVLAADNAEPEVSGQPVQKETPEDEPAQPEIKFLENPLPLPKKHEKRTVDFPIASADDDDYDYAVADDDDYDIQ